MESEYYSYWYTRVQGILYILAFLTFGITDSMSSALMMIKKGIIYESNFLPMLVGINGFVTFKIFITVVALLLIFQRESYKSFWMVNGALISFISMGTFATIMNLRVLQNEIMLLSTQEVIIISLGMNILLICVGDIMDNKISRTMINYSQCVKHDVEILMKIKNRCIKIGNKNE